MGFAGQMALLALTLSQGSHPQSSIGHILAHQSHHLLQHLCLSCVVNILLRDGVSTVWVMFNQLASTLQPDLDLEKIY